MKFRLWQPVSLRFMLKNTLGATFLAHTDDSDEGVVFNFQRQRGGTGTLTYAHTTDLDRPRQLERVNEKTRLGVMARDLLAAKTVHILGAPPVRWGESSPWPWRRNRRTEILLPGTMHLDGDNLVEFARAKRRGEHPEVRAVEERRTEAEAAVEEIREEFGLLSTDVVYRIDNSALFDTSVPATEQFHAALIIFADLRSDAPIAEVEAQAAEVEVAYSLARANAERLGLSHLPETVRDDARRASKAAHLAANATTEGERVASLTQAARILESLAIYYLPTLSRETLAIEAPTKEQPPHGD